jgi:hypothetical protein
MGTAHFEEAAAEWGDTMEFGLIMGLLADEVMLVGRRVTGCTDRLLRPG